MSPAAGAVEGSRAPEDSTSTGSSAAEAERDLRGEPARLQLSVEPPDAAVYLDGRLLGSGRELAGLHAGLLVDPGAHVLEVVRPGFSTKKLDFSLESGDDLSLEVTLTDG